MPIAGFQSSFFKTSRLCVNGQHLFSSRCGGRLSNPEWPGPYSVSVDASGWAQTSLVVHGFKLQPSFTPGADPCSLFWAGVPGSCKAGSLLDQPVLRCLILLTHGNHSTPREVAVFELTSTGHFLLLRGPRWSRPFDWPPDNPPPPWAPVTPWGVDPAATGSGDLCLFLELVSFCPGLGASKLLHRESAWAPLSEHLHHPDW